ncbi:hypothetical protein RvY_06132 [Ramazzottius varieornatus]|uniref:Gamma-tubulin complex component n=1 Tax=Ramazzottius varieornatus TaxID=947166 RepID=A0A1D1UY06_RAMVA|nr:hypothetical protein RvY_06132 [Ramazzottius varieornatus]
MQVVNVDLGLLELMRWLVVLQLGTLGTFSRPKPVAESLKSRSHVRQLLLHSCRPKAILAGITHVQIAQVPGIQCPSRSVWKVPWVLQEFDEVVRVSLSKEASTTSNISGDLGRQYVNCLRSSMEQIRQRVTDELFILAMFERLYTSQMTIICTWLTERMDRALNAHQVNCLSTIIKKSFAEFELQGIPEEVLNSKNYQTIQNRMRLEEATAAVSETTFLSGLRVSMPKFSMLEKAKKMALS